MIEGWISNISTFWTSPAWKAKFGSAKLGEVYDSHLDLQIRQAEDILRLRFSTVFFHDLLCLLSPMNSKRALPRIYELIADIIFKSSSKDHSIENITAKVRDCVKGARRYEKLISTFGNGILVELPVDVSTYA